MIQSSFSEEAERCRLRAVAYAGKPEAPFLLKVAKAFEELHVAQRTGGWTRCGEPR